MVSTPNAPEGLFERIEKALISSNLLFAKVKERKYFEKLEE